MKHLLFLSLIILFTGKNIQAQQVEIYPKHWWAGMNNGKVQLMLYAKENLPDKFTSENKKIKVETIFQPVNKNYLFVDLNIAKAKPGKYNFRLRNNILEYEIKEKRSATDAGWINGVDNSDFMYLIMPDRF